MRTDKVEINLYRIPLPTPIQAASTDVMTGFDLVMARVWDSDGASGCGYTLVPQGQGGSIATLLRDVFADEPLEQCGESSPSGSSASRIE